MPRLRTGVRMFNRGVLHWLDGCYDVPDIPSYPTLSYIAPSEHRWSVTDPASRDDRQGETSPCRPVKLPPRLSALAPLWASESPARCARWPHTCVVRLYCQRTKW